MSRIILHIDMNSYFASVEQQARPSLHGKPIGVTGSTKKRTIIAAASVEAKKFGVKTGTQLYEAKQLCPSIVLIGADCKRYESVTRQFLDIFFSKTPNVEIFSIDEAFLDLTGQVSTFEEAKKVGEQIKEEMRKKIGPFVTCSIGIAQNKFMAKLASEAKKPDGLTVVDKGSEINFLDRFPLSDACGIGSRTEEHLNRLGVFTFEDLRILNQTTLTLTFNSYGLFLYNISRGIDNSRVKPYFESSIAKSISRSKTLPNNSTDSILLKKMILSFCQNISAELRQKDLRATKVAIWLRFGDFTSWGQMKRIKSDTNLTESLYRNILILLRENKFSKPVRKIGIYAGGLIKETNQLTLSEKFEKPLILEKTADLLNKKYGTRVVTRSSLVNLGFSGQAPSFGFKKDFFA